MNFERMSKQQLVERLRSLESAEQALIEGLSRGWDTKDSSAIWLLQEERAGVKVRSES